MPSLDLSYEEVDSYITQINAGGKIVQVECLDGKSLPLFISHPSLKDKMYSDFEYKKSYDKAISEGFLTAEQTRELMYSKGFFTKEDEDRVGKLRDKLEGQYKLMEMITKVPSRKENVQNNIERIVKEIECILIKKETGLEFSADRKASESKYLYLTYKCTKDLDTFEQYWPTLDRFKEEKDILLRKACFVETITLHLGLDTSILRFLARSNSWRIRYSSAVKIGESLFDRPLTEYTIDQLGLVYWSSYYQSIYDMMPDDRPDDSIINDDISLDAFMKSYMEEQSRESAAAREKGKKGSHKTAWDHGDVLVMKSNPVYEELEYSETFEAARNKTSSDLKEVNTKAKDNRSAIRKQRSRLRENL